MLPLHRVAVRPIIRHGLGVPQLHLHRTRRTTNGPRSFVTEAVQAASDGFLDLALALPFPAALPPYSGTIILVTLVSRFMTVPFTIWVRFQTTTNLVFCSDTPTVEEKTMEDRRRGSTATEAGKVADIQACIWRNEEG
jgi:hypothetical protein